jgi:hypothetical protein
MDNMGFNIHFIKKSQHLGRGEIVINGFSERFESPFDFWTAADYERQWAQGVTRILEGELKSVLVTSMVQPEIANFIMWWPMYRDGNLVVFRNHLLMMQQSGQLFTIPNLYSFIPDRLDSADAEFKVSEWTIELDKMKSFSRENNT